MRQRCSTAPNPEQRDTGIASAISALKGGRLVVLPTDTVYGIGADAFDSDAVAALLSAKGRGRDMPVPVLVGSWHTIDGLVYTVPHSCTRTHSGVLARRAESRGAPGPVAAMGPRRRARHGDVAHAAASGRDRTAARGRADGGVERQHLGPSRGGHRRRCAQSARRSRRGVSRRRTLGTAGGVDDRRPHRRPSARAPAGPGHGGGHREGPRRGTRAHAAPDARARRLRFVQYGSAGGERRQWPTDCSRSPIGARACRCASSRSSG